MIHTQFFLFVFFEKQQFLERLKVKGEGGGEEDKNMSTVQDVMHNRVKYNKKWPDATFSFPIAKITPRVSADIDTHPILFSLQTTPL